jgi:hypothetical protein
MWRADERALGVKKAIVVFRQSRGPRSFCSRTGKDKT